MASLGYLALYCLFIINMGKKKAHVRTFAPIVTAHLYCTCYSLGTRVPRHTSSARTEQKTQQNIVLMAAGLTWCENIFVGCTVTPTFFSVDHFLF